MPDSAGSRDQGPHHRALAPEALAARIKGALDRTREAKAIGDPPAPAMADGDLARSGPGRAEDPADTDQAIIESEGQRKEFCPFPFRG